MRGAMRSEEGGSDIKVIPGVYVDEDASEGCRDDRGVTSNSRYATLLLLSLLLPSERALRVRLRIIGGNTSVKPVIVVLVLVAVAVAVVFVVVVVVSSIFSCAERLWDSPSSNTVIDDTNPVPCPSPCLCPSPCIIGFIV